MKKEKPPLTSPAPKASEGKRIGRVCPSQAHPNRCTHYHKGGRNRKPLDTLFLQNRGAGKIPTDRPLTAKMVSRR